MTVTSKQIGLIRSLQHRASMDDDTYRQFLKSNFQVVSTKELSIAQAGRAIDRLKEMTGQASPAANGAVAGLDSAIGGKLRALWIAGWNLGLVRDRTDRAMLAFLERQTGVSHTRFLKHPADATAAIEGLKAWLARDGGVIWPHAELRAQKQAICEAQWRRLVAIGEVSSFWECMLPQYVFKVTSLNNWDALSPEKFADVQNALGRKLRGAMARRQKTGGTQ
jgi:phage gp16-like protein